MSVRFYKILCIVFLAHLVALNFIWVGFSAPGPRPPARFTYEGALPLENGATEDAWHGNTTKLILDQPETAYSNQWATMRELLKPINNLNHL